MNAEMAFLKNSCERILEGDGFMLFPYHKKIKNFNY
jgi:hypothetical protein